MIKKEVYISKKATYVLMNVSLVLSFLFSFLALGNTSFAQKYSFSSVISGFAKESETGSFNVTVSANSKKEYQELATFNGANLNNPDVYKNSLLAIPDDTNALELKFDEETILPTTFTLRTLFSYKTKDAQEGDPYKLESDNLYIYRTEKSSQEKKSIVVSKGIAEIIVASQGGGDYKAALEQELELNYFDFNMEPTTLPVFVKGIVVEDAGVMPTHAANYGNNLIFLAGNAYDYNIVGSHLDIRYTQSVYRNSIHTDALIKEFGIRRLSFSNNNFLSNLQQENIERSYSSIYIESGLSSRPLLIAFLTLSLVSIAIAIFSIILHFKDVDNINRKYKFISILPFLLLLVVFYALTTILYFITRANVEAGTYLIAPRSVILIAFLIVGLAIVLLPSKKKGIDVDEKTED